MRGITIINYDVALNVMLTNRHHVVETTDGAKLPTNYIAITETSIKASQRALASRSVNSTFSASFLKTWINPIFV